MTRLESVARAIWGVYVLRVDAGLGDYDAAAPETQQVALEMAQAAIDAADAPEPKEAA